MPSKCFVFIVIGIYLLALKQNFNSFHYFGVDIRICTQPINRHPMRPLPQTVEQGFTVYGTLPVRRLPRVGVDIRIFKQAINRHPMRPLQ